MVFLDVLRGYVVADQSMNVLTERMLDGVCQLVQLGKGNCLLRPPLRWALVITDASSCDRIRLPHTQFDINQLLHIPIQYIYPIN